MILEFFGWGVFLLALMFIGVVVVVHRLGRNHAWVRVARAADESVITPDDGECDWRDVVTTAVTEGVVVRAVEWPLVRGAATRIVTDRGLEAPAEWSADDRDASLVVRVTLPGDGWNDSLDRVGGVTGLQSSGVGGDWVADLPGEIVVDVGRARLVVRAPQVVVDIPIERSGDLVNVSPAVVEWIRRTDPTSLMIVASLIGAIGLVMTTTMLGVASGVVLLVALSGACKFVFMSRRSDPTREQFLQNY